MKKSENLIQKLFGSFSFGNSRVPLKSNVFNKGGSRGYSPIGQTGNSRLFDSQRQSPLLGNSSPSNRISGWLERVDELKGYQLLDISKLATNFFADYVINFLKDSNQQVVTILDEEGNNNETVTDRINNILIKDIKIFDYIRDHIQDSIFFGEYFSMLQTSRDESGHLKFAVEELYDPVTVVVKKKKNSDGVIEELFLARGDDGAIYEIPRNKAFYIGNLNLRLINDLEDGWKEKKDKPKLSSSKNKEKNLDKVLQKCSYVSGEPLFYSLILKVKELIIKELLVSLISLRDLSSVQIFLLQFDKSTPLETASELCARTTKLANNTNELASFLTSQFDVTSFIENTLTQSAKFVPDFNATLGNKNSMLPLDKLSDKLLDILQSLDSCRNNVLSPLGLPSTLLDSTSGSKWAILQQSERANSRVTSFMTGIKDSVSNLVQTIYRVLYDEELDPARIKLHISEKTSVEYNNQLNQSESVSGVVNGISNILQVSLQALEGAAPLLEPQAYLSYIQNLLKDIDPNTEPMITEETISKYIELLQAKMNQQMEQLGMGGEGMM